jgi:hypothetical protein
VSERPKAICPKLADVDGKPRYRDGWRFRPYFDWLEHVELSAHARIVYGVLANAAASGQSNVTLGMADIATRSGLSERPTQLRIAELE